MFKVGNEQSSATLAGKQLVRRERHTHTQCLDTTYTMYPIISTTRGKRLALHKVFQDKPSSLHPPPQKKRCAGVIKPGALETNCLTWSGKRSSINSDLNQSFPSSRSVQFYWPSPAECAKLSSSQFLQCRRINNLHSSDARHTIPLQCMQCLCPELQRQPTSACRRSVISLDAFTAASS